MYNWSVNEDKLKQDPEKYAIWKLEQMVNFGLGDDKINQDDLIKYWDKIKIDAARRKFLAVILDEK